MKFQNLNLFLNNGRTEGRTDGRTDKPKPICSPLFQSWGPKEQVKLAVYQAGYCWGSNPCCTSTVTEPLRMGMGKRPDYHWVPFWASLPEAAKVCKELFICGLYKRRSATSFHFSAGTIHR